MFNFFSRPSQKKSSTILASNTPPKAALESDCNGSVTHNGNGYETDGCNGSVTVGEGIEKRINSAKDIMIGMPMVCVMCQSITPKTKTTKLCCSPRCRVRLCRYRQERDHWTHYRFNDDGSIIQLNRWREKHVTADQLYGSTVALGKRIYQMTQGNMICIETLEAIKQRLS